jgi:hypothetical protein
MRARGRRRTPSHLKHEDAGRRRTPSHLKHEDAGETKDALPPEDEEAQNLLILRSEATAEPRRRGGFAIVPLAGEVGEREAQAR